MSLKLQLMSDLKQAMKDRKPEVVSVLRFLLAEIKNVEIDAGELDDAGITRVVAKQIKQMKDTLGDFEKAGRNDLVSEELSKITILQAYVPEQMQPDVIRDVVREIIAQSKDSSMGSIMKQARARIGSQADGGSIAQIVKELLP